MNLKKVLSPDTVWMDLKAETKTGIIEEMIDRLAAAGKINDRSAVLEAILDREAKMSTGMQNGVAIPHGKTDAVKSLVAAIGLRKAGVDFDSMDGKPAHLFFLLVAPEESVGVHLKTLARISKLLKSTAVRERLQSAVDSVEIHRIISEEEEHL